MPNENINLASETPPSSDVDSSSTSNSTSDGVLLCNGNACQASIVSPISSPNIPPSNSKSPSNLSPQSLPFINLDKIPINSRAFFPLGASTLLSSNQVTLSSLPPEGALLKIVDDPTMSEENNTCQFAFHINDEPNFYCYIKTDRKVYNGDKLRFVHVPSRYWSKRMIMHYQIGSTYSGEWYAETMPDPGTKAIRSGTFGFELTHAQLNNMIYSDTVTIKGLAANVRAVPVQVLGLQDGFELSINGQWIASANQYPSYGVWVKNNDQLQFRITPRRLDTIYRAKILFEKVGLRNGTFSYTQSDYIDWSIRVDTGISTAPIVSFCETGAVTGVPSIDGTQVCDFSWQAAALGNKAQVTINGIGASLDATCTENQKYWTYNFHCPGTLKKSCFGGQIANIASKSKAKTFCVFSWGMTEVGKSAGIVSSNGGTASNYVCKSDGTYTEGSFICP